MIFSIINIHFFDIYNFKEHTVYFIPGENFSQNFSYNFLEFLYNFSKFLYNFITFSHFLYELEHFSENLQLFLEFSYMLIMKYQVCKYETGIYQ